MVDTGEIKKEIEANPQNHSIFIICGKCKVSVVGEKSERLDINERLIIIKPPSVAIAYKKMGELPELIIDNAEIDLFYSITNNLMIVVRNDKKRMNIVFEFESISKIEKFMGGEQHQISEEVPSSVGERNIPLLILKVIEETPFHMGKRKIAQILGGSHSRFIKNNRLDNSKYYGTLKFHRLKEIEKIILKLRDFGYIRQIYEQSYEYTYAVFVLTGKGKITLEKNEDIVLENDKKTSLKNTMTPYELGESNKKEAIPLLIKHLDSPNYNEKRLAASALGKLSHLKPEIYGAVPKLIELLKSEAPQIRQYTIKALGEIGDVRALPMLKKIAYDKERNGYNIAAALNAIGKIEKIGKNKQRILREFKNNEYGNNFPEYLKDLDFEEDEVKLKATIPILIEKLQINNLNTQRQYVTVLSKLSYLKPEIYEAIPHLINLCYSKGKQVRKLASRALGVLGDPTVLPKLKEIFNNNRDDKYFCNSLTIAFDWLNYVSIDNNTRQYQESIDRENHSRFVTLAVTRMYHGNVCVAGMSLEGKWIRPVYSERGLTVDDLYDGKKVVFRDYSYVDFYFKGKLSNKPHSEDCVIDELRKPAYVGFLT